MAAGMFTDDDGHPSSNRVKTMLLTIAGILIGFGTLGGEAKGYEVSTGIPLVQTLLGLGVVGTGVQKFAEKGGNKQAAPQMPDAPMRSVGQVASIPKAFIKNIPGV